MIRAIAIIGPFNTRTSTMSSFLPAVARRVKLAYRGPNHWCRANPPILPWVQAIWPPGHHCQACLQGCIAGMRKSTGNHNRCICPADHANGSIVRCVHSNHRAIAM